MSSRIVPVGLIVSYLKDLLDGDALVSDVWVEGEVSHVFRARSGHVYFTLNDGEVTLKCVLFRTAADRQLRLPEVGDSLVAHGHVGLYEREGTVQLYADVVQAAGVGILALQFEQLRQRLESEGLFETSRKRALPLRPRAIGVVTSPDGAVWHDIQQVLQRRFPFVEVVLAPSLVQGDRAPERLIAALDAIQRQDAVDVIIIGRGGGSAEDLSAFNDERVARTVFASRVPIVSAVGHETDWTIIDFVADVRAATPSVAAELCVPSRIELLEQLGDQQSRFTRAVGELVARERWNALHQRRRLRRIDIRTAIELWRTSLDHQRDTLDRSGKSQVAERVRSLDRQRAVLRTMNPRSVLQRGYAVVTDSETGQVVVSSELATTRPALDLDFSDGEVTVRPVMSAGARRAAKERSLGIEAPRR